MYLNPQYRQDLFKGTSAYYSQYRTPYIKNMIEELIKSAGITPDDTLLDIACGPGRLTLPMSGYFRKVFAIDWEKEMIEEGERVSKNLKIENIKWIIGKAEEQNFEPGTFKLITIGDAFHRLDQLRILENSYKMLASGGCIALIWSSTVTNGEEAWQKELKRITSPWAKPNSPAANTINNVQFGETTLKEFGFRDVSSKTFEEKLMLNIKEITGYLYSMSVYSKNVIGDGYLEFESAIKDCLLQINPDNKFECVFGCGYYLGRKG